MILDRNMFIERVLPGSVLRKLTEAEMAEYRKPFLRARGPLADADLAAPDPDRRRARRRGADRRRLFAMDGGKRLPETVRQRRTGRDPDWRRQRDFCRTWKNQTEVTVPGSHFIQEDSGPAIGQAIAAWMNAHAI